jgi:hypothetical protein
MVLGRGSDLLLAHSYSLTDGGRVRLRIARARDAAGIRELIARNGVSLDELEVARLTRFDPRQRFVVCVTRLLAGREQVVGVGAIALGAEATAEPELLVVDEELGDSVAELLRGALVSRALASARGRAA